MLTNYLWVAMGGALGSVGRYWLSGIFAEKVGLAFPFGTLEFGAGVVLAPSPAEVPNGFAVVGEFTTARYSQQQNGRLIEGCTLSTPCLSHTTTLHDSILSGLVGYANTGGRTRLQFVGGIGARLDSPEIDGEPRDASETNHDRGMPFVLTGGFDVMHSLSARSALVLGARYAYGERAENHRYLGIGAHIFRVSAGLRVRLN